MPRPNAKSLPIQFQSPGLLSGGGVNKAGTRTAIGSTLVQSWNLNNVYPTTYGYGNKGDIGDSGIGVSKIITGSPLQGKIQGIGAYLDDYIYIKLGRVFKVNKAGGLETEITAGTAIFDTSARITFESCRGKVSGTKYELLYLIDSSGNNNPYYYNGTTLTEMTVFNSAILGITWTKPVGAINWLDRLIWFFHSSSAYKNYVLASDIDDANTYTGLGADDNAFNISVYPGEEQDYITALGTTKRAGADLDNQELIVYKNKIAYISGQRTTPNGNSPITVFNRMSEIGAVNHSSVVNFNNSIYSLNKQGIGSFDNATASGGVYAYSYQDGTRINALVQEASLSSNFNKSFALHCPERQLIIFSMPQNASTSLNENGYSYGEIPNNLSICLRYGVQDLTGEIINQWFTFNGTGWGWACGYVNEKDIVLGDYFEGQIYKWFSSNEFQRNITAPNTQVIIKSTYESGDMVLETPETNYKSIIELILFWYIYLSANCCIHIYYDGKETGDTYNLTFSGALSGTGIYGVSSYGTGTYANQVQSIVNLAPANGGRKVRIKIEWNSLYNNINNWASLQGYSGTVLYGSRLTRTY